MDKFTVVAFYEDDTIIHTENVEAEDSNDAVRVATASIKEHYPDVKHFTSELAIIEIFAGHPESLNDCRTVSNAIDWPGMN